nr:hypothetical transcript [Hymenolepis microstoma]
MSMICRTTDRLQFLPLVRTTWSQIAMNHKQRQSSTLQECRMGLHAMKKRKSQQQKSLPVADHIPSPEELIEKGQYLVDCPSWLAFIGEDKRLQYSNHFISRNDKIWELISTEIRYVDLLVMIRDVFMKAFPPRNEDSLTLGDNLFPHLDDVLECHNRLLYFMLEAHNATPDHITKNLGQCFTTTVSSKAAFKDIILLFMPQGGQSS